MREQPVDAEILDHYRAGNGRSARKRDERVFGALFVTRRFMEFFAKCWPVMLIARDDCFLCIAAKKGLSLLKICMNFFGPKLFCLQLLTSSYILNLSGSPCIDYFYS
jgi:hypothetical protein